MNRHQTVGTGERERLVVVGNGMVGHRFCERIAELDTARRYQVTVVGEEPRTAYDRVHLSEYFAGRGAADLALADADWYGEREIALHLSSRARAIDTSTRIVHTEDGRSVGYDQLVLATGSAPFVPPIEGVDLPGVFVYRTIEDLEAIGVWAVGARRAAVIGGGLLGLEAAKALVDMQLETHVVEFAPRLMPRQVDDAGGALLRASIEAIGVRVHVDARTEAVVGDGRVEALRLADAPDLAVDMLVVSAGIRPRDELARAAGLAVGERGGIVVDDRLVTSDARIHAIGECASHRDFVYGLVAPGYEMADVVARRLVGEECAFEGADMSTKLKLLGVDVASFGDAFADHVSDAASDDAANGDGAIRPVVFEDRRRGVYQKVLVDVREDRVVGGILVGDADAYATLADAARRGRALPDRLEAWMFGGALGAAAEDAALDDAAQVCSCNNVTVADVRCAIAEEGLDSVSGVKSCTRAGTGCGGCVPQLGQILAAALESEGRAIDRDLCEHFSHTREELYWIVKLGRIESFDALIESHGRGDGCEICRPAVASILASTWNDLVVEHAEVQDTNDRFLANIQRGGTYSVIPRVPGGEITPDKLIVLGEVAAKYDLSCKITGGQRIDLLGARVDQLPDIWEDLVAAGFESGHAYGKAMRTVKSCVGSAWCRYGVQDSTGFAIRIEERYRGLRAPHKLKSAVSGCIRECAEAQSKDFGIIATENGWNLYLGGNGGSSPRHADLVATDLADDEVIALIDRFLMFYIQTAKPLQRTARWLEELDGGVAYLKSVIVDDVLGIGEQLEADMQRLVDSYRCEWRAVVEDPERRASFRHYVDAKRADESARFVRERGQKRPVDWPASVPAAPTGVLARAATPAGVDRQDVPVEERAEWVEVANVGDVPRDGGRVIDHGGVQIALYHFARRGEWYATQNLCPHRREMVLARGLLGTQGDEPKVACPMHKKTFSLRSGKGLSDPAWSVKTFPVEQRGDALFVRLPPAETLREAIGGCEQKCS